MNARQHWFYRVWSGLLLGLMAIFIVNIALMVAAVATNSVARRWLGTWLPEGYTTNWYVAAWKEFQLGDVLWVTAEVVLAVVVLSIAIGVPAAYALARKNFAGKNLVMLLFILPLIIPPITYGIPMATVMYQAHLGGTLWGVILSNLVPALPFVILVMTPFIEQIDPTLESAARVFGALAGATLSTALGLGRTYLFVTAFYLASLALTLGVSRSPSRAGPMGASRPDSALAGTGRDLRDGLVHVARTPILLAVRDDSRGDAPAPPRQS
jgi:ABC-type spermidine/putrescine transport system permease subunit II